MKSLEISAGQEWFDVKTHPNLTRTPCKNSRKFPEPRGPVESTETLEPCDDPEEKKSKHKQKHGKTSQIRKHRKHENENQKMKPVKTKTSQWSKSPVE
jgi:hypothetical protein